MAFTSKIITVGSQGYGWEVLEDGNPYAASTSAYEDADDAEAAAIQAVGVTAWGTPTTDDSYPVASADIAPEAVTPSKVGVLAGVTTVLNNDYEIANDTVTRIEWDAADFDPSDLWDVGDPESFVIPSDLAGWWQVSASVEWDSNASGIRILGIELAGQYQIRASATAIANLQQTISQPLAVSGNTVYITAYQNSGAPRELKVTTRGPSATLIRLGPYE